MFPPTSIRSNTRTSSPSVAPYNAASNPIGPAPMMAIRLFESIILATTGRARAAVVVGDGRGLVSLALRFAWMARLSASAEELFCFRQRDLLARRYRLEMRTIGFTRVDLVSLVAYRESRAPLDAM